MRRSVLRRSEIEWQREVLPEHQVTMLDQYRRDGACQLRIETSMVSLVDRGWRAMLRIDGSDQVGEGCPVDVGGADFSPNEIFAAPAALPVKHGCEFVQELGD